MAAWKDHWPLARRWAFVKPRLLRLPQKSHGMDVDFCPLPDNVCDEHGFWLGLVVDDGFGLILMTSILDEPPIVQDLLEIHEELGVFGMLTDLRILAHQFLFFEQPKHE